MGRVTLGLLALILLGAISPAWSAIELLVSEALPRGPEGEALIYAVVKAAGVSKLAYAGRQRIELVVNQSAEPCCRWTMNVSLCLVDSQSKLEIIHEKSGLC